MNCRYCQQPVDKPEKTLSYWQSLDYVCHPECKVAGKREEALLCQTIDSDCNDCKHFKRRTIVKRPGFKVNSIPGQCLKFDRPTVAFPHMSTGKECFEHRRSN